jgi:putative transcriptional regulator
MPNEPSKLSNRLRRLRFENGEMTQQALAERVGVTRQTIIALEAGKYVPSLLLAFRLARVFGVRVEEVFQLEGEAGPADGKARRP